MFVIEFNTDRLFYYFGSMIAVSFGLTSCSTMYFLYEDHEDTWELLSELLRLKTAKPQYSIVLLTVNIVGYSVALNTMEVMQIKISISPDKQKCRNAALNEIFHLISPFQRLTLVHDLTYFYWLCNYEILHTYSPILSVGVFWNFV